MNKNYSSICSGWLAVFEVVDGKRQCVKLRFESSEERSIRRFLKTDELHQVHPFTIYLFPYLRQLQDIRVGKIGFNGTGSINRFADIAENKDYL